MTQPWLVSPELGLLSPSVGLISCAGTCGIVNPNGGLDLTSAVAPSLLSLFQDTSLRFLGPVERGYQVELAPSSGVLIMLGVPRTFGLSSSVDEILSNGNSIFGAHSVTEASAALASVPLGPDERSDPQFAFSLKQSALYVAGGKLSSGVPLGRLVARPAKHAVAAHSRRIFR